MPKHFAVNQDLSINGASIVLTESEKRLISAVVYGDHTGKHPEFLVVRHTRLSLQKARPKIKPEHHATLDAIVKKLS